MMQKNLHIVAFDYSKAIECKKIIDKSDKPVIICLPSDQDALILLKELKALIKNLDIDFLSSNGNQPYQFKPNNYENQLSRIRSLGKIYQKKLPKVLLLSIDNLFYRFPPKEEFIDETLSIHIRDERYDEIINYLFKYEFLRVNTVTNIGEFSMRGSIIDFFSSAHDSPLRINFDDQKVEKITLFDIDSQLSTHDLSNCIISPFKEFLLSHELIDRFKTNFRTYVDVDHNESTIYQKVSMGYVPIGIEHYLPLFFDQTLILMDLIDEPCQWISIGEFQNNYKKFSIMIYENFQKQNNQELLKPELLYQLEEDSNHAISTEYLITISSNVPNTKDKQIVKANSQTLHHIYDSKSWLSSLLNYQASSQYKIIFSSSSPGKNQVLADLLKSHNINVLLSKETIPAIKFHDSKIIISSGYIDKGVIDHEQKIIFIPTELVTDAIASSSKKRQDVDLSKYFAHLEQFTKDSHVIHKRFGLGIYRGLRKLDVGGMDNEFICLEYADRDLLYIPVYEINEVTKYSDANIKNPVLHKLGTNQWSKAKSKAERNIRDVAVELLTVYAKRKNAANKMRAIDEDEYQKFCREFAFEETVDQLRVIHEIEDEYRTGKLIDRLICADVGYGKTEVALRAAYMHLLNNEKVIFLVPTTLLAQQHFENITERFSQFACSIGILSRLQSKDSVHDTFNLISEGKLDILIATHKALFHKDLLKQFGLIVIDEEHKFGVRQKEVLTSIRSNQNILSLTATPIPRTLNLSLNGVKDISLIATPPENKQGIDTYHIHWDKQKITEGIQNELKRGGQVYFVHNRVRELERIHEKLINLIPQLRISIAHGQMSATELNQSMRGFIDKKTDLLLCTTIIESGIDNHNVNTIFINDADSMGLAQVHQLRGRVGRGSRKAFCYVVTRPEQLLSSDGKLRLRAIESMSDLGAGFSLAAHDLEIRGAGEILGARQSGDIQQIGFNYYNELLSKAIEAIKNNHLNSIDLSFDQSIEINLSIPALIPEDYMPDINQRISFYRKITDSDDFNRVKIELIDRYGPIPIEIENFYLINRIKKLLKKALAVKINGNAERFKITLSENHLFNIDKILRDTQDRSLAYEISIGKDNSLTFRSLMDFNFTKDILDTIERYV